MYGELWVLGPATHAGIFRGATLGWTLACESTPQTSFANSATAAVAFSQWSVLVDSQHNWEHEGLSEGWEINLQPKPPALTQDGCMICLTAHVLNEEKLPSSQRQRHSRRVSPRYP